MNFKADRQTQEDLNLPGKFKNNSIYSLFNKVNSTGGERLLEQLFVQPLKDAAAINQRSNVFRYFHHHPLDFPFDSDTLRQMEDYLRSNAAGKWQESVVLIRKKWMQQLGMGKDFQPILENLRLSIAVLNKLPDLLLSISHAPLFGRLQEVRNILQLPGIQELLQYPAGKELSFSKAIRFNNLLRVRFRDHMDVLLRFIYELDLYSTVGRVAAAENLNYAEALPAEAGMISIEECRHPVLKGAVANSLHLTGSNNVLFLTGANMAGKSTFMKSFGIAVYLAHAGFPVAAKQMRFSVMEGLYSSINVPDNLQSGYSHFYAEVRRVKDIATDVSEGKNMVVIFDELFKGTNVKDAYDATLSVTRAFAGYPNCFYIISTHIIEVTEALASVPNISFHYFPTIMEGTVPRYTYRLQKGVTTDRHGMRIIHNEGIIGIIRNGKHFEEGLLQDNRLT